MTAMVLGVAPVIAATLSADNEPQNVVIDGDFERNGLSLTIDDGGPLPLMVGGWASRALDTSALRYGPRAGGSDNRWLQLSTPRGTPTNIVQDVALATRSYRLEARVQPLRGRQSIRLVSDWDRREPVSATPELELVVEDDRLVARTPAAVVEARMATPPGDWIAISAVADTRDDLVRVYVDGLLVATVPGLGARPPRTLVIGGDGAARSRFRYDDVVLLRLAEIEIAEIRRLALRAVAEPDLAAVTGRLDSTVRALARSGTVFAGPELRAAARLVERLERSARSAARSPEFGALAGLRGAIEQAILLLQEP